MWSRGVCRGGAPVAWRGGRALDTYGWLGVGEAGVERREIGYALIDKVGGRPGGLTGREPDGIDGLLRSKGLVFHDVINDFGEVVVE